MTGSGEHGGPSDTPDSREALADRREMDAVYQPAEDSRLLADTVVERIGPDALVLEVGTGSGYVAGRVAEATGARVVGSDISPLAVRQARENGVPAVRADLLTAFRAEAFDAVLFNPPYLPTDPDEEWGDWMEHALSGGPDGRRVVDPFLDTVGRVLRPDGRAYLLVSSLTGVDAVRDRARTAGLATETITTESFPFEQLFVLCITRMH